jgi:hypothetical protein
VFFSIAAWLLRSGKVTAGAVLAGILCLFEILNYSSGSRAAGLADQMVALGDVRGPPGGVGVRRGGGGQVADVPEEGHVRLYVLRRPLVHRGHGTVRLRAAAVVLEQQVLRHRGLLVSWAAPVEALHLVSGAGRRFSTSCR